MPRRHVEGNTGAGGLLVEDHRQHLAVQRLVGVGHALGPAAAAQLAQPRIGDDRNNKQYQLASMFKSGAQIAYGSDWPVTSQVPLEALAVPTHRQSADRQPANGWSPHESIAIEQSLSFYTHGVAHQNFNEDRFGNIAVGMQADLMILESNPLNTSPHDVAQIKITAVYKKGESVFPS